MKPTPTGIQAALELLASLDEAHREKLLKNIALENPALAQELSRRLHRFEDLIHLSQQDFQIWFKELPKAKLNASLRGASEEILNFFKNNLTQRAYALLIEEVNTMGPMRVTDIQIAREELVQLAKKLHTEGKILFEIKPKP